MKPASTSPDSRPLSNTGHDIDLDITGMTCAACASRIERKLNKLDGVEASVNYATEKARVRLADRPIDVAELIAVVEATGYGANLPDATADGPDRVAELRRRLVVAVVLGLPVLLLSMVPALQFDGWQWVALVLASPVATWAAWPFHRAMATNLRHGQSTMDTLISVGVTAAFAWSLWALLFTPAGEIGMTMSMSLDIDRGGGHHIYLEVASTVVAFILAGRYFEARAKRRAGDALRALVDLGAKEAAVLDPDGSERRIPIDRLAVGDRFVVRPGEKVATDGVVVEGASAIDQALVTGESVPVEVGPGDPVIGATVNEHGRLVVEARRVGADHSSPGHTQVHSAGALYTGWGALRFALGRHVGFVEAENLGGDGWVGEDADDLSPYAAASGNGVRLAARGTEGTLVELPLPADAVGDVRATVFLTVRGRRPRVTRAGAGRLEPRRSTRRAGATPSAMTRGRPRWSARRSEGRSRR